MEIIGLFLFIYAVSFIIDFRRAMKKRAMEREAMKREAMKRIAMKK